jgi:predicted  nucleic acid-binding Zn-ribbon protein
MKKSKEIKCMHRFFNVISKDDAHCADCGNKVLMYVPEDENEEAYFEILESDADGTFTTLRRSYREQMNLSLNLDRTLH